MRARGWPRRVDPWDLVRVARHVAALLRAGIPLVEALWLLARQRRGRRMGDVLTQVQRDLEGGATFAGALRRHPLIFEPVLLALVEVGEAAGCLDEVLERWAEAREAILTARMHVRRVWIHVGLTSTVAVVVTVLMLVYVIPTFERMFDGFGAALPQPTATVIAASRFVRSPGGPALLGGLVASALVARLLLRQRWAAPVVDRLLLAVPGFGPMLLHTAVGRFYRGLSTLTRSGVPLPRALALSGACAGSPTVRRAAGRIRRGLTAGAGLAEALGSERTLPEISSQIVASGDRCGRIHEAFGKAAELHEADAAERLEAAHVLAEPVLIVALGLVVGGLIVSMYLPVFSCCGCVI